jgi:ABC-type uncharacterized transport system substrate-binding protein
LRRALVVVAAAWVPLAADAHPHVFIDQHVAALFGPAGITGFRLTWRFDPLYSSMMRSDYVASKTGPLTQGDVQHLHDQCFVDLKDEHYFTTITLNGKPIEFGEPTDFRATASGENIIYSFVMPLPPDAVTAQGDNTISISVFDPSYYVYYELAASNPVTQAGGARFGATCGAKTVLRDSIGWGRVKSDVVTCTYHSPGS